MVLLKYLDWKYCGIYLLIRFAWRNRGELVIYLILNKWRPWHGYLFSYLFICRSFHIFIFSNNITAYWIGIADFPVTDLFSYGLGERVLQRLEAAEAACSEASGSGGESAFHCGSPSSVRSQLSAVRSAHTHAHKLWQHKKMQLDQCFQLRLFEQDCEKVLSY